jgi:Uma2 family endonuclease
MAKKMIRNLLSVKEYLASEVESSFKREYIGGEVYRVPHERNVHNLIASNTLASLHNRLRGHPNRPFNSDTKIRIRLPTHIRFYYPDVSVVCRSNPQNWSFQDEPTVIVEVLSKATRRIDGVEKKDAYLTIPSLAAYVLLEQNAALAVVHRRTEQGFVREVYDDLKSVISLAEIGVDLPLAEIYEDVEFIPELDNEEQVG